MQSNISIISQLYERLQSLKGPLSGDIYGLVQEETGDITLLTVTSQGTSSLSHNPSLLLPSGIQLLGTFQVRLDDNESGLEATSSCSEEQKLLVIISKGDVTIQRPGDTSSQWQDVDFTIVSQEEFEDDVIVCRVRFDLDLSSRDKTADVKSRAAQIRADLSDGCCFLLQNTDLVLSARADEGNDATDEGERAEGVLCYGGCFTDPEQIIGEAIENLSSKPGYKSVDSLVFEVLQNKSSSVSTDAPVVKVTNQKVSIQKTFLKAEVVAYVWRSSGIGDIGKVLLTAVLQHVRCAEYWLLKALSNDKLKGDLESVNVLPYKTGHMFTLIYPVAASEDDLTEYRLSVNQSFLLPKSPFMRRCNTFEFSCDKKSYHLYNTHIGLKPPNVSGLSGITQGIYSYHHYMQDKFNDNKWGCAYRSLQTVVSWFRHQGYTTKPVPTHRDIQQCLVKLGDKPAKFVGSTDWIGSTEVGFFLESYLDVTSRFISVSSGDELCDKGRELVHHFNTQGTPVMIGGGVLAHTILGVAWNPESGDINYLILDPHFTGHEDLALIQKQGWCGWKGPSFWNSKAYYNLCLPQRPAVV